MRDFLKRYDEIMLGTNSLFEAMQAFPCKRGEIIEYPEVSEKLSNGPAIIFVTGASGKDCERIAEELKSKMSTAEVVNLYEYRSILEDCKTEGDFVEMYEMVLDDFTDFIEKILEKKGVAICVGGFFELRLRAALVSFFSKYVRTSCVVHVRMQAATFFQRVYDETYKLWMEEKGTRTFGEAYESRQAEIMPIFELDSENSMTYRNGVDYIAGVLVD